jgi:hypothetical protein
MAIRVEGGEQLMAVLEEIQSRWTPGNEYLWDEYEPESLLDTAEKRQYLVNALLFARLTLYRALRGTGHDVRGQDPFECTDLVPEVFARLLLRFPQALGESAQRGLNLEVHTLKLSPGDPGLGAVGPEGKKD